MRTPRVEIDLDAITQNARVLVERFAALRLAVCGVTKATAGSPEVARALIAAGVASLGESRIENVERLRRAGVAASILLVRSPMVSEVERVVRSVDVSLNSELEVVRLLGESARRQRRTHGVVLMVELGDLREGMMPSDVHETVRQVLDVPGITLVGIGTNLACRSGVVPDASNMGELSALASAIEADFGVVLDIVSGGNSANLSWASVPGVDVGRVNHLRLGEAVLLGRDPVRGDPVNGLGTRAFTIVGEVIESKIKPVRARGTIGRTAFGRPGDGSVDAWRPWEPLAGPNARHQVVVALGRQDVDPDGLTLPDGFRLLGTSSDHLVLAALGRPPAVGEELRFGVDYSALLRAMGSRSVGVYHRAGTALPPT